MNTTRTRRCIFAVAVVALAASTPPAAHAEPRTVVIDGITYEVVAEGVITVPGVDPLHLDTDLLDVATTPIRKTCAPSVSDARVVGLSWQTLVNNVTYERFYLWRGTGYVETGYCASDVTAVVRITDLPLVTGTGTGPLFSTSTVGGATVVANSRHYGSVTGVNNTKVLYYDLDRGYSRAVIGSVSVQVNGLYTDYQTGRSRKVDDCERYGFDFVATPDGPQPIPMTSGYTPCAP